MTDKFNRTHGSTGTEPPNGKEFQQDERPDESHFDWFWYQVHTKINSLIDEVNNRLKQSNYTPVNDVDGEVDNAANSVAGLDDAVAGKASDNHGNEAHSEDFVTSAESSTYTDSDAVSAVDGEIDNAANNVAALDNAVAGKAESSELYSDSDAVSAVDGEVNNAANSVAGLDDTVNGLTNEPSFVTESVTKTLSSNLNTIFSPSTSGTIVGWSYESSGGISVGIEDETPNAFLGSIGSDGSIEIFNSRNSSFTATINFIIAT